MNSSISIPIRNAFQSLDDNDYSKAYQYLETAFRTKDIWSRNAFIMELRREGNRTISLADDLLDEQYGSHIEDLLLETGFVLFEWQSDRFSTRPTCPALTARELLSRQRLDRQEDVFEEFERTGTIETVGLTPLDWNILWKERTVTPVIGGDQTISEIGEFTGFSLDVTYGRTKVVRQTSGIKLKRASLVASRPIWMRNLQQDAAIECSCYRQHHTEVDVLLRFNGSLVVL